MKLEDCLDEIAHQRSTDMYYVINVINCKSRKKEVKYKNYYVKVRIMKTPLASIEVTIPLGNDKEVWEQYKSLDKEQLHELVRDEVEARTKSIITKMLTIR